MEGLDDHAPVSRSAPHQSSLGYNVTSLGSHPDMQLMSQSPRHEQQQQQHGRRRRQSSSATTFFRDNVDDVRQDSPPHASDRPRILHAPPPYSRRDVDQSSPSPTRRLFFFGNDDSPSPPPLQSPGNSTPSTARQPRYPPRSPRLLSLQRNAASDNSVSQLTYRLF